MRGLSSCYSEVRLHSVLDQCFEVFQADKVVHSCYTSPQDTARIITVEFKVSLDHILILKLLWDAEKTPVSKYKSKTTTIKITIKQQ